MQTFEHWIVEPDAHGPASYWRQRLAAYVRDCDERATGLIDLATPAAATNLSDGAANPRGHRGCLRRSASRTASPAIPDAEEAVML